jgi:hypothetical protein
LLERTSDEAETSRERALDSGIARGSTCAGRRDASAELPFSIVYNTRRRDASTRRVDETRSLRDVKSNANEKTRSSDV